MSPKTYCGLDADPNPLSPLARIVLDARLFGLLPMDEDCAGWDMGRLQALMEQVEREWDKYGNLPSRLPPELAALHRELYDLQIARARAAGWDPELGDED